MLCKKTNYFINLIINYEKGYLTLTKLHSLLTFCSVVFKASNYENYFVGACD